MVRRGSCHLVSLNNPFPTRSGAPAWGGSSILGASITPRSEYSPTIPFTPVQSVEDRRVQVLLSHTVGQPVRGRQHRRQAIPNRRRISRNRRKASRSHQRISRSRLKASRSRQPKILSRRSMMTTRTTIAIHCAATSSLAAH